MRRVFPERPLWLRQRQRADTSTVGPVSYTHLDVYKRQALDWTITHDPSTVWCTATAETTGPTGVEMEALTAVQVALLTVYDMCKAVDRGMTMDGVRLLEKQGGKSGHFVAPARPEAPAA